MRVCLPQLIWYGNTTLEIDLPEDWDVEYCPMRGASRPCMSIEQMEKTIRNPIGTPPLRELAKGKKRVVIIFDDMTRPTRTYELAPIVLRELAEGGVKEDDIVFVCALGTHGALSMKELRKKLGQEIVERYRVFNHNIYENCVDVGITSRGTRLMINREVAEADLKVAIGCVTAHAQAGFSGGGKIVLPGVCHVDSIAHYHLEVEAMAKETTGLGNFDNNILRFEIEEAARMVGLNFVINVLVNQRGAASALYAGELIEMHRQAVELAKEVYATEPRPWNKDLVIANAFVKPNEMGICILLGALALRDLTGTLVIIANAPEGQVVHYLLGRFGRDYGGRQYPITAFPSSIDVIIMTPHPDRTFADWFSNPDGVNYTKDWESTMRILRQRHGPGTKVAVIPTATMQYYDH